MQSIHRRLRPLLFTAASTALLSLGGTASAQTLQEAMMEAYNTNPALLAERARLRSTDEELAQANSGWRPRVSVNGSASVSDDFTGTVTDRTRGWSANITASQSLYNGGRVPAQRELAKAQIRAGRASLAGVEAAILLQTVAAYMDVVRDSAVLELSRRQVEVLSRERQASQDRFDVGEITRTDVAQAEARLSGAQTSLIQAQAQLEASRAAFIRIVGRAPKNLESAPRLPKLPASLEDAVNSSLALNPTLVAARENQLAAEAAIDIAVSALLPQIDLEAQYSLGDQTDTVNIFNPREPNKNDTERLTIGLGATVPLYQGGGEYSSIRQAKQQNSQSRLLASQAEREAIEDVTNAWEALEAARASIRSAQDQVRASEIAFEGVRQEADVGARTTLDVLNAEQELLNARVTLITNQRNEYVAAYSLLSAMGRLSALDLSLPVEIYDPTLHADGVAGKLIGVGSE